MPFPFIWWVTQLSELNRRGSYEAGFDGAGNASALPWYLIRHGFWDHPSVERAADKETSHLRQTNNTNTHGRSNPLNWVAIYEKNKKSTCRSTYKNKFFPMWNWYKREKAMFILRSGASPLKHQNSKYIWSKTNYWYLCVRWHGLQCSRWQKHI